jgi:hypothetical protein
VAVYDEPAKDLTAVSFKLIWVVPFPPFSISIETPAVVPAKLIGPEEFSVIKIPYNVIDPDPVHL